MENLVFLLSFPAHEIGVRPDLPTFATLQKTLTESAKVEEPEPWPAANRCAAEWRPRICSIGAEQQCSGPAEVRAMAVEEASCMVQRAGAARHQGRLHSSAQRQPRPHTEANSRRGLRQCPRSAACGLQHGKSSLRMMLTWPKSGKMEVRSSRSKPIASKSQQHQEAIAAVLECSGGFVKLQLGQSRSVTGGSVANTQVSHPSDTAADPFVLRSIVCTHDRCPCYRSVKNRSK